MSPEEIANFKEWGVPLPKREAHGTPEDIRAQLKPLKPRNWRLQGNKLTADTEMGQLVNYISPNYLMTGLDDEGLPIFRKLVL